MLRQVLLNVKCKRVCFSATEAFDDDGLPHTLEHLIFLGSEQYPYKGVLDLLANRCLASGTNAWTGKKRFDSYYNLKFGSKKIYSITWYQIK